MKNMKKTMTLALSSVMILSNVAFAADGDVYLKKDGGLEFYGSRSQVQRNVGKRRPVASNPENYAFEINEKAYNMEDVNKAFNVDEDKFMEETEKTYEGVPVEEQELKVTKVSAITDTLYAGSDKEQKLEFTINDGKEVTIKDLEEADYKVEFLTSAGLKVSKVGVLAATDAGDYTYIVKITKAEEDDVLSTEKEVKVVNATDVVEIKKTNLEDMIITAKNGDDVTVKILEHVQADGEVIVQEEGKTKDLTEGWIVKSSDGFVLNPSGNKLMILGSGKTTISLEKKGMPTYSYEVDVKEDASKATKATAKDITISFVQKENVEFKVEDQYGQEIKGIKIQLVSAVEKDSIVDLTEAGVIKAAEVDGKNKAGTETIYIYHEDDEVMDKDTRLGSFKVTVQKFGIEVKQELVLDGKTTLDVNNSKENKDKTLKVSLVGKDSNGVVTHNYKITKVIVKGTEDAPTEVVKVGNFGETITLEAFESGEETLTIVAEAKEGKDEVKKDLKVKVVDSTKPTLTTQVTIELTGKDETLINIPTINFSQEVKLVSAKIGGVNVPNDLILEAVGKLGTNFVTNYQKTVVINKNISEKTLKELGVEVGTVLEATVVNKAGIENTFTVTVVAE